MPDCCHNTQSEIDKLHLGQRNVLVAVLGINAVFFLLEFSAGLAASSTALLADSLDMLGDTLVYAFSLYVVFQDDLWKARAAAVKGWIMFGFGLFVLAQAGYKLAFPELPGYQVIEVVALLALLANASCLLLLWRHRSDDVNMRSVWLCSRNDIIANISVLIAGGCVWVLASQAPDIIVGVGIAVLYLKSAVQVLKDSAAAKAEYGTT